MTKVTFAFVAWFALVLSSATFYACQPAYAKDETEGYVRLCSRWHGKTMEQAAAEMEQSVQKMEQIMETVAKSKVYSRLTDADVIAAARQFLARSNLSVPDISNNSSITITARNFANYESAFPGWQTGPGELVVVGVKTPADTSRFILTFDQNGHVTKAAPISPERLAHAYLGKREIIGFVWLNELTASDAVIPRVDCATEAHVEALQLPELRKELERAALTEPTPDPSLVSMVSTEFAAYAAKASSLTTPEGSLTRETIAKLGSRPAVKIVYLDSDQVQGIEVVVAEIGATDHAYFMVTSTREKTESMSGFPLCVSGDLRCGKYYQYGWP